jgi:hypothetical protein
LNFRQFLQGKSIRRKKKPLYGQIPSGPVVEQLLFADSVLPEDFEVLKLGYATMQLGLWIVAPEQSAEFGGDGFKMASLFVKMGLHILEAHRFLKAYRKAYLSFQTRKFLALATTHAE